MFKVVKKIRRFYMDLKLNYKISLIYVIVLIFFISFSCLIYYKVVVEGSAQRVKEYSKQVLTIQESAVKDKINNMNSISRMIMANTSIQFFLSNAKREYTVQSKEVFEQILNYLNIYPVARTITIYDKFHNEYGGGKSKEEKFGDNIFEQPWFAEVENLKGGFLLKVNIHRNDEFPEENVISLIRVINDVQTQKPIGVLVLDILESELLGYQTNLNQYKGAQTLIIDENNQEIYSDVECKFLSEELLKKGETDGEFFFLIQKIEGSDYVLASKKIDDWGWQIISVNSLAYVGDEAFEIKNMLLITLFFNTAIFLIASFFISRSITNPIHKLVQAMNKVKKGTFKKVNINMGNDEIGVLKDNYNNMLDEIQTLIQRVVNTEMQRKQYELNALYEQIKPHFLYNTLDSIGYLVLSGDNEKAYSAIETLGSYYRTSLSSGEQTVTIEQEINIVIDYLELQKLRYGDIFEFHYNIQPELKEIKTLKLILQPMVENALYHGIRPTGSKETITINIQGDEEKIRFEICNTGKGMTADTIQKILSSTENNKNFGLKGTIERIQIYYNCDNCFEIESEETVGTIIVFKVPYLLEVPKRTDRS